MQSIVVTGVSTGIGWAIAKVLIERGCRVFGSVRKPQDAERLSKEFGQNFVPLLFDVTDEPAVQAAAQQVRQQLNGETLLGLVNNAGIAVPGALMYLATDDFRHQLEVNLVSVLIVTKAFLPLLGADRALHGKPGRIVNISSTGGKNGSPFLGAYAASKHGLEGFSESLRRELMLYGIDVVIIAPGAIATPIWDKAEESNVSMYANTDYAESARIIYDYMLRYGKSGLPAQTVGELTWHALSTAHPRVRYAPAPGSPLVHYLQEHLPKRLVDRVIAQGLRFNRRAKAS